MKSIISLALEGDTDGIPHVEREITAYVLVRDLLDVKELAESTETHEQWRIKTDSDKGNMRIRLTDGVEFTLTTKEKTSKHYESLETEQLITKEFFEVLKRSYAYDGYLKTRYNIPIEDSKRKWEVDVFKKSNGTDSKWVKLDYEFGDGEEELPEIPFEYLEIFIPDIQEDKKELVKDLWENEWSKLDAENT